MEERNLKWGGPAMSRSEEPKPAATFVHFFLIIPIFSTEKWGGWPPPIRKVGGLGPLAPPVPPSMFAAFLTAAVS